MKRRIGVTLLFLFAFGVIATALAQTTGVNDVEIERFVLPGTNTTGFRVHGNRTEMNLRLPAGDIWAQGGYKVQYGFSHGRRIVQGTSNSNAAAVGTIGVSGTSGVLYASTPYAGSVVAVAIASSQALTAGYAHAEASVYQVAGDQIFRTGLTAMIGFTETGFTRSRASSQAKDLDRFLATEGVGCQMTTTSDLTPASAELLCTVVVEM